MSHRHLLVELGTEELPPKALRQLSRAFENEITAGLETAGLAFSAAESFASPRRLAVLVKDLQEKQADRQIQKRGPALKAAFNDDGTPSRAAEGFARSCQTTVEALEKLETEQGSWLVFNTVETGKPTRELVPGIVEQALHKLPIPKRMRWGSRKVQFVRPAHWLVCLFGNDVIDCTLLDQTAGRQTYGHRYHAPEALDIDAPEHYASLLETRGKVIPDFTTRRAMIRAEVLEQAKRLGGQAVIPEDLLDEVTALVEYPVALVGSFEERFLAVPQEALIYTMQDNQKYFAVLDDNGKLMPHFIFIANIDSRTPQAVISGNEKVVRPRLADAEFFYQTDLKLTLEEHNAGNYRAVFQVQLGSIGEKAERIAVLAEHIANCIHANPEYTRLAGSLSKADLNTAMVYEFDAMQGIMGKYLARHEGLPDEVAQALEEQYLPRFAGDRIPSTETGICVSIADKLDTLCGIFGIGQTPTGDKDPFALRRATLGILRMIIDGCYDLDLAELIDKSIALLGDKLTNPDTRSQVLEFINSRYRAWYQEQGVATDTLLAVLAVAPTRPLDFENRIRAVEAFRQLPEASALAAANKRVSNILAKQEAFTPGEPDPALLQEAEEKSLAEAVSATIARIQPMLDAGEYEFALKALAGLQQPVDAFFEKVMVNAEDPALRLNRLHLLARLQQVFSSVADIGLLQ